MHHSRFTKLCHVCAADFDKQARLNASLETNKIVEYSKVNLEEIK